MSRFEEIMLKSKVSILNSTNTLLGPNGVFLGQAEEGEGYGILYVTIYSDKASATDGFKIQQSHDGNHWHWEDSYSVPAGRGKAYSFNLHAKYFRLQYTNGAESQSDFEFQSILKGTGKPSTHRVQDTLSDEDDGELNVSVLKLRTEENDYISGKATPKGNFAVSVQEYGDTPSIDAFDRLRVSMPYTIFDSKQLHDKQPLFWDELIGGSGSSVHVPVDACTRMTITASVSDFVIRQTKQRFNYQPGKGQLILQTFYAPQEIGLTKRIGLFDGTGVNNRDPNNGIFFETNNGLSWNICKNGTITESIPQSEWNIDTLDGNGLSGKTYNPSACQILVIDFEWLGVGRVRVGFVMDGMIIYTHAFNHANNALFSSVYMSSPNLPLRYSIETDGTNGGTLDHICSTVISEGGLEKTGILRSIDNGTTEVLCALVGTSYALLGIKLKSDYKDITVIPEDVSIVCTSNDSFKWSLKLNPTVAGVFTYFALSNSALEYAVGIATNTVTGGITIASGYASTSTRAIENVLKTALTLGMTMNGVADSLVLCVDPLSANATMLGALGVRELL